MKKYISDFKKISNEQLHANYGLLKLKPIEGKLPEILPGQFCQVEIKNSKNTFLRRPISVNYVDYEADLLWLLVRKAGEGTNALINMKAGEEVNLVYPMGNGFTVPEDKTKRLLLIGGGVGVAPLLYFGEVLKNAGIEVNFLLGARSKADLLELEEFKKRGNVFLSTEDGSEGEKGFVTTHSVLAQKWDSIACCGPMPMMKAVARYAAENDVDCEVSLENVMACGVGACLCCVEDTTDHGNVCVCKEGPVFNIKRLKW